MDNIRYEVTNKYQGHHLESWLKEARDVFKFDVENIRETHFYLISSDSSDLSERMAKEILCDPVLDSFHSEQWDDEDAKFAIEIGLKAGVTDNSAKSVQEAFSIFDVQAKVSTGKVFWVYGNLDRKEAEKMAFEILANPLLNSIKISTLKELRSAERFQEVLLPEVKISGTGEVHTIDLNISEQELEQLSIDRCLALTVQELTTIRDFYNSENTKFDREKNGLPLCPTDVELEVLAQTWSEHCKHKIFSAQIEYAESVKPLYGPELGNIKVNSLFKEFIKDTTEKIKKDRKLGWLISVFSDNAGIVRFDEKVDLCFKAETHNSPSALDPYGGALTGILGVNRDILGCGLGSRPIANTDVFCFAPSDLGDKDNGKSLPVGPKPPRRTIEGVHKGVEDGGNKSGIPTVNGAFFFDPNYAGKPLVFCGTVGVMPRKLKDGRAIESKGQMPGDRIFMVGGAIGADGIHGATFSSLELDENSPATAVQIGDPITQKRVMDFMMVARDRGLYTSVTDNGAGGLSSSVGEMAELTGGAIVDLSKAPTKYPGLRPYELFISESQERMTFSVHPSRASEFKSLAKEYSVSASDIGEFSDSGYLEINYGVEQVAKLDLKFLHTGLPQMKLNCSWNGEINKRDNWYNGEELEKFNGVKNRNFFEKTLESLLARPTIASKEEWVRRFDHEVQGATHIKPFGGKKGEAPNDSGVIWLGPHGGELDNGIAIGCGIAPRISLYDTYLMAQFSVDEAFRNIIASGADPETVCLLDNFCWPDPIYNDVKNKDGSHKLAQLVRACKGLSDICEAYGAPLVSGKDSMKNDFRGKNGYGDDIKVSVLPTLLVSAMGKTNIKHSCQSSFRNAGDQIFLIGGLGSGLLASELLEILSMKEAKLPTIDLAQNYSRYKKIHSALGRGILTSLHDISDGGLSVALAEGCFGNDLGVKVTVESKDLVESLFNEAPGRFILSCSPSKLSDLKDIFENDLIHLGEVMEEATMAISSGEDLLVSKNINDLQKIWRTSIC